MTAHTWAGWSYTVDATPIPPAFYRREPCQECRGTRVHTATCTLDTRAARHAVDNLLAVATVATR